MGADMKRTTYAVAFSLACPSFASCANQVDLPPQQIETVEQPFGTWQRVSGGECLVDIASFGSGLIGLGCTDLDSLHNRAIRVRQSNGAWGPFPGAAISIASDGSGLVAVSGDGELFAWHIAEQNWQLFLGVQGRGAPELGGGIAMFGNTYYVLGTDSQVYQYAAHCNFNDCSASQWEKLQPGIGSMLRLSTSSTLGVTVTAAGCGLNNVYRHPALPGVGWSTVGGAGIEGCFRTVTSELPASPNFEQYWGARTSDGLPRQYNSATGFWDVRPLPASAVPYDHAILIVGVNQANRVYALGLTSDPQGNLWVNQ